MSWQGIEGHDAVVEQFRRVLERGRLASTYLFVGPAGVGKRAFAERLAATLLCQTVDAAKMAPCGTCDACRQVAARTHPDLITISRPADKSFIPLSAFIGDGDKRMRQGLCHDIALKSFMGGRKVALIDDADDLNEESANALLKTLEEPPPCTVLILIGTSVQKQLPTIRSRAQIVRFRPLPADVVAGLLVSQGLVTDPAKARQLAELSGGSLTRAMELADDDLWAFRRQLLSALVPADVDTAALSPEVVSFVDSAGKEAPLRRARARQVVGFAIEFYRQLLRAQSGAEPAGDADLLSAVRQAAAARAQARPGGPLSTAASLDRSIEAAEHIDRNAHQAALLECWLDEV